MKFILLFIFGAISFSASAQWWRLDLKLKKKPPEHPAMIEPGANHAIARLPRETIARQKVYPVKFSPSDYSYEAAEDVILTAAKHNMRFRIYNDASYNFSELARLYMLQNRFSEAKWYLLQSNQISRQQNDDQHTILNLIDLATIKANIGDYALAQEDLTEAHDLAYAKGLKDCLAEIAKKMSYIKQNKLPPVTPVLRYAEMPQNISKAE
jgi:hypothetical protein